VCHGKRLKPEALSVKFAGYDIAEFSNLPLSRVAEVLRPVAHGHMEGAHDHAVLSREAARDAVRKRVAEGGSAHAAAPDVRRTPNLSEEKVIAAQRIAREFLARIATLEQLGLGYISLDRSTPTLSPGELQRLRLATQLSSHLFGVVYVLDEPSAGLHPADGEALLEALDRLKAAGNTIFVVEHDLSVMRRADWLIDVGPDAGEHGGRIVYSGPPSGLEHVEESRTRAHLFGHERPAERARIEPREWLRLEGVTRNNLRGADVQFPLGCFTVVTGVSGSGKSSLVSQALIDLVSHHLGLPRDQDPAEGDLPALESVDASAPTSGRITQGLDRVKRLVQVDQKPIGRTPRSNLATYTGLFDAVRKLFAATPQARKRKYDAGRFSFNVAKGRCETCEGEGFVSVELLFMPSVYAPCPQCHGARYNGPTLEVKWNGKNIAEVLRMTVEEASDFFANEPAIARPLKVLKDIGLGYLRLGQPATELSGGEAQRIKLATELQRTQRGETLYVLDEPTTGLHACDVDRLMKQLDSLVAAGNTLIVVEHEMRVAAQADWVIDVGPGAGDEGGRIVAEGPPEKVAATQGSRTASYLAECHPGPPG
jgi:excinuclease ABC subunit A